MKSIKENYRKNKKEGIKMNKKELNNNEIEKVSGGNGEKDKCNKLKPWGDHPVMMYGGIKPYDDKLPFDITYENKPLFFKKKWVHEQREKGVKIAENLKKMHEDLMDGEFGSEKDK